MALVTTTRWPTPAAAAEVTSVCARRTARSRRCSGTDLQVDGEVRAGRHVDEGVDVAEADRHLRRVEVDHPPVRAVDRPALPVQPDHGAGAPGPGRAVQQGPQDRFTHG